MAKTLLSNAENAVLSTATVSLIGVVYIGAFSLFTHGAHTPTFYAYQTDRTPNAPAIIPLADALLGTSLLFKKTRVWAATICTLDQGGFIIKRLIEGKGVESDLGIFALAAGVAALTWFGEGEGEQNGVNFRVNVTRAGYCDVV